MNNDSLDADLYQRVVDLQTRNPNVKVWISVGGWTFNDPGIFQSVFRRIAGNNASTLIFTHNLMAFLLKHGFDGVDIDWEYTGADDWGGVPKDVVTLPRMLRTLKRSLQGETSMQRVGESRLLCQPLAGIYAGLTFTPWRMWLTNST
jgi:chitinase